MGLNLGVINIAVIDREFPVSKRQTYNLGNYFCLFYSVFFKENIVTDQCD